MLKRKPSKDIKIDNLLGPGTHVHGDVEFAGGLHLEGTINGNVTCRAGADAVLSVSEAGCITGSVLAPNVLLNGMVEGDIDVAGRVELGAKARVLGHVHYSVIETAVGAQINGKLIHRGSASPAAGAAGAKAAVAAGTGAEEAARAEAGAVTTGGATAVEAAEAAGATGFADSAAAGRAGPGSDAEGSDSGVH